MYYNACASKEPSDYSPSTVLIHIERTDEEAYSLCDKLKNACTRHVTHHTVITGYFSTKIGTRLHGRFFLGLLDMEYEMTVDRASKVHDKKNLIL